MTGAASPSGWHGGVSYGTAAENLAGGQATPHQVIDEWKRPDGHNKNMLKAGVTAPASAAPLPARALTGRPDTTVWRPSTGQWFISRSTGGSAIITWGAAGDVLVPSDYDGDSRTDVAV